MSELSTQSRSIVTDGRSALAPTEAERRRIRAGISARLAGIAIASAPGEAFATTASGSASTTSLSIATVVKLTVVAGTIAAAGGGAWVLLSSPAGSIVESGLPPGAPQQQAPAVDDLVPAPAPTVVPLALPPAGTTSNPEPDRVRGRPPASGDPVATTSLSAEVLLLESARQAIARGELHLAMPALDRYDREHPGGQLEHEAMLLRADALCRLGRRDEAQLVLGRARSRQPAAPGIEAVAESCTLAGPSPGE